MNPEYEKELKMSYRELWSYLQGKYGLSPCDYFSSPTCKSKNKKVTRTKDGLLCHHIWEDRHGDLGHPLIAKDAPFEAQKKENLVYCNYIEHLLLHLKIQTKGNLNFEYAAEVGCFLGSPGFYMIAKDINDLYKAGGSKQEWRENCYKAIEDDFEDYVSILRATLCLVDDNYHGIRGDEENKYLFKYEDIFEEKRREMAMLYDGTYWDKLLERLDETFNESDRIVVGWLKMAHDSCD